MILRGRNVEQRPLWDRVEKLQPRPGSGSSSGSSNSSSQASPGDRFRPRCESPGTVLGYISLTLPTASQQMIVITVITPLLLISVLSARTPVCFLHFFIRAIKDCTFPFTNSTSFCSLKASSKSEGSPLQRPENVPKKQDEKNLARPTRPAVSPLLLK